MKTMTCKQMGGACDHEFRGQTFDQIAEMSKHHGMEMYQEGDPEHVKAMEQMQSLMNDPDAIQSWMAARQKEFDALPDDESPFPTQF
ncbi:DUF1059 domain-containing protein [Candidatus Microgenomates bacterium]|nr:DUF1059 domain-containing protein [Candidatus Microgenomates bacterium]